MRTMFFAFLTTVLMTFGVAGAGLADSSYSLKSGDILDIEVLEDPSLNRQALVLPDGTISFPLVGSISAAGRNIGQVQQALVAGLASNFAVAPNVFVSVRTLAKRTATRSGPARVRTSDVYIMGEVASPGKMEIKPGTTLLQFLAEAGGLTRFAAEKRIELHRTDPVTGESTVFLFSYSGKGNGPRIPGSTKLMVGDVVIVPQRRLFE